MAAERAFRALPVAERRAILHRIILARPHSHNSYIELIRIGDAASAPYLIRALAWEAATSRRQGL